MRHRLALAALLTSTALVAPERAAAEPVSAFIYGVGAGLAGATTLTVTAATASAAIAGYSLATSAIGGLLIKAGLSIGLSLLAAALQPGPNIPKPAAQMRNFAQPVTYAEFALGRVRKGGPLGFTRAQGSYRYYVPIVAAHSVHGIYQHYIDERPAELNELDEIVVPDVGSKGRIQFFDGQPGQTANSELMANFPGVITEAHDFKGLAGAVVRAKKAKNPANTTKYYPGQIPWAYTPVIEGLDQIYDPRTDSTGYTNNAALVIAWWLTERLGQQVDWDDVAIEADVSDEPVARADGGTQPRWTINTVITDDQDFETQRAQLCAACDAFLYERTDGRVGFYVGRYVEPDVTLIADDFWSINEVQGQTGSSAPTEIVPEYIEPENHWREFSAGAYVLTEAERVVRDTPQLYAIDSHNQATRIAKRLGRVKRARFQIQATIGLMGYELIGKRFFRLQHPLLGLDRVFEIGELARVDLSSFQLSAVSVTEEDFAFDAATEEPPRPAIPPDDSSTSTIPDITGVVAVSEVEGQIRVSWTAQDDIYTQEARIVDDGGRVILRNTTAMAGEPDNLIFSGLPVGATYDVQARNVSSTRQGDWIPETPISVTASGGSAAQPVIDSALGLFESVRFIGTAGARTTALRVYRNTVDDFSGATQIGGTYAASPFADFEIQPTSPTGAAFFWVVGLNSEGNLGTPTASYNLTPF